MKLKNFFYSVLVSVFTIAGVTSCVHTPNQTVCDAVDSKVKKFDITYFCGPSGDNLVKEEVIADIAASGITLMQLCSSPESIKQALPIMAKYNLCGNIMDGRISDLVYRNDLESVDSTVKQVAEEYREFENVTGWEVVDEPNAKSFPVLGAITKALNKYSPGKDVVINLFPNYASPEQLGTPDYMTYLERFATEVGPNVLSYDHYHFLGREGRNKVLDLNVDERERLIRISAEKTIDREGFFENIEDIRNVALKYDMDPMLIVLLVEHGPYRNLTRSEILWEANMCLVYGMKRISYFTYWCPGSGPDDPWQWDNAMCDTKGNKMQHWYDVQSVNAEVMGIGNYLFPKKCEYVAHIGNVEKGSQEFAPYGKIESVTGKDGVISFFDDGSIYLVNKDFLNEGTFTLQSKKSLKKYADGKFVPQKDTTITLGAGQGILLK